MLGLRQRPLTLWFGAACLLATTLSVACGSDKSLASILSPTEGATVAGITLSMNVPPVGGTVQATAVASFSTGGTAVVTTGFSSDAPTVATTTSAGRLTGVAVGDVTIMVEYSGARATKRVRVLPSYSGLFSGTYTVVGCSQSDGFAVEGFCTPFTKGLVLAIDFSHDQSSDLTSLTGQFRLGQSIGSGVGTVAPSGALNYSGSLVGATRRMDFRNWAATSPSPGRINGSFEMVWTDSTVSGSGIITATNMDMVRQSASFPQPVSSRGRLLDRTSLARLLLQK